jgi:hypothetical protein
VTCAPRAPLALAFARALAGAGAEPEAEGPPVRWTLEGSRLAFTLARLADPLVAAAEPVGRVAERLAPLLASRPLRWVAAAAVGAPLLLLALPSAAGGAAALALAAAAGLSLLFAAASAMHDGAERGLVLRVLVAGLLLRAILGAFLHLRGGFPDEFGYYHPLAVDAASCWRAGGPSILSTHPVVEHRAAYFYLLSGAYLLLGDSIVVGRVLGVLLGLFAALLAGEVARPMGGRRAAALAVGVLALHPEHALWSATLSRDTLTTLLVLLALAAVLRRPGTLLRGNLLLALAPVGLLAFNSFLAAGALGAALALLLLGEAVAGPAPPSLRVARPVVACVLAGGALLLVGWRWGTLFHPALFTAVRSKAIGTAPDFAPGLKLEGMGDVLLFLPAGALFVLTAPWPWAADNIGRVLYGIPAALGLAVAALGAAGLLAAARRRPAAAAPPILFALAYLALLALLEGNSGIVVRHRLPLTALLAVGAGVLLAGLGRPEAARR